MEQETDIFYRVQKDDTIEKICKKLETNKEYILSFNNIDFENLEQGDVIYLPQKSIKTYVVKPMDTLSIIAQKNGITEQEIKQKNNVEVLFVGQKLFL